MSFTAFLSGCNAVCYRKNNKDYGMICAWATMVDYEKVAMLLGSQSATGNNLQIGDIVGISALATNQKNICDILGNYDVSSKDHNKVKDLASNEYYYDNEAILINNARTNMVAKVVNILKLDQNSDDHFIIFEILKKIENNDAKFMAFKE